MSELNDPPLPVPPAEPSHRARGGRMILLALAVIALVATLVYLLRDPGRWHLAQAPAPATVAAAADDTGRVAALSGEVAQLRQRLETLEQRVATQATPPATPPDATPAPAAQPPAPNSVTDPLVLALNARIDQLSGRQDRLDAQIIDQGTQLKTDAARLQAAANQADVVSALTERTGRLARLQAAQAALSAGLPLGELPGAPAALARFRTDPPPTESQLRLAFPAAAAAARAAARPDTARLGFWRAMRERAEALITVRRGDTVLIGSSQIGVIDRARTALDAGDLTAAVSILGALDGPAAAAMADWRGRAQALLDARLALARLASQS